MRTEAKKKEKKNEMTKELKKENRKKEKRKKARLIMKITGLGYRMDEWTEEGYYERKTEWKQE